MGATWKYTLQRLAASTLGWGVVMILSATLVILSFDHMIQHNKQTLIDLIEGMPPALRAMVGSAEQFATPRGFLDAKFFVQSGLFLGIHAVLAGSGLLAVDEEKGRLDLLASYPVSRRALFWGRVAALVTSIAAIVALAWLGLVASLPMTTLEIRPTELTASCLSLLALTLFHAALALLLSLVLPSRRSAAATAGGVLLVGFLMTLLAPALDFLRPIHAVTPFRFYQGGRAMTGLDPVGLIVLIVLTAAALVTAWQLFERRDIRVMGESTVNLRRVAWRLSGCLVLYLAIVVPVAALQPLPTRPSSPAELLPDRLNDILPNP